MEHSSVTLKAACINVLVIERGLQVLMPGKVAVKSPEDCFICNAHCSKGVL